MSKDPFANEYDQNSQNGYPAPPPEFRDNAQMASQGFEGQPPVNQYGQTYANQSSNSRNTQSHDMNNYGQAPQNNYGQVPQNNYGQAPMNNYGQAPVNNYGQTSPGNQMNESSQMNQYGQPSVPQYNQQQMVQNQSQMPGNDMTSNQKWRRIRDLKHSIIRGQARVTPEERNRVKQKNMISTTSSMMFYGTLIYTTIMQTRLGSFVIPKSVIWIGMDLFAFAYSIKRSREYEAEVKLIDDKYLSQGINLLL